MKISFLGTGLIGTGLAESARKRALEGVSEGREEQIFAFNRTIDKARPLEERGIVVSPTASEAVAGASRVHIAVSDDAAVDRLLESCMDQIGDAIVVDHTTTSPKGTAARAARLAKHGIGFIHAPVFMSPQMCREARGVMLAAGPQAVYDKVKAGLDEMTGNVVYLGERTDLAAANKLFGNAMIVTLTAGLSDVFAMAAEQGIEPSDARNLFDKFNAGGVLSFRGKNMATGNYQASFELTMARKDVGLMIDSAGDRHLTVLPAVAKQMDRLIAEGHGADDLGVMAVDTVPKKIPSNGPASKKS